MKANELRIGNYTSLTSGGNTSIIQVNARHILEVSNSELRLDPILLTEEWLLKLGFYRNKENYFKNFGNGEEFIITTFNESFYLGEDSAIGINAIYSPIKFVHQLQNLYHPSTSGELTIKQTY